MSEGQWKRWEVIKRLRAGKLTMAQAALVLALSARQVRRVRDRVAQGGRAALRHGNTGRAPAHTLVAADRTRIVQLRREKYHDFNDAHFAEKLATEAPPLRVSVATVRRLLRAAGVPAVWRRRPRRHRKRRERKAQAGLMLLWDGSRHDWLEGRGPWLCLVGAIDDATGVLLPGAHFVAQECAAAYLRVLHAIATECGLPGSIYMDQHGALRRNDDHWTLAEELRGRQDPTQVGGALEALGITAIYALSPQAKGRVERLWGTLQDRLTSELRLAHAGTVPEAQAILARYRLEHNRRFAVAPKDCTPAWHRVRRGLDLDRACSFRYEATVRKDNTVRLGGTIVLDIPPGPRKCTYADQRVDVHQLLDGSWRVYRGEHLIATRAATAHEELRPLRRRKRGRGAPATRPEHAVVVEACP